MEEKIEGVDSLRRLYDGYATHAYSPSSPLNAAISRAVSRDDSILELLHQCEPRYHDPNLLLAAIQYLVSTTAGAPLAEAYREGVWSSAALAGQVHEMVLDRWSAVEGLIRRRFVQTNEIGRSPVLALALSVAAVRLGGPIELIDAGASAGLNLVLDRYRFDYGDGRFLGSPTSPVCLQCRLCPTEMAVPPAFPVIGSRIGVDRRPVKLSDDDSVRWLLSCIWPGPDGRQDRARAAIEVARSSGVTVLEADMVEFLDQHLGQGSAPAVVTTSWSLSYLAAEAQDAFVETVIRGGQSRPLAWICFDAPGVGPFQGVDLGDRPKGMTSVLGIAFCAGGDIEAHVLGLGHPHGSWLDWTNEDLRPAD